MTEPTGPTDGPVGPVGPEGPDRPHDETGLDLARSVARSLARGRPARRGRRGGRGTGDPAGRQSSGAHPDDRDPQTLDTTIGRLVADRGWGTDVRVHGVFSRWDRIVGPEVAQHARPVAFERDAGAEPGGGRLVVQTDSTAWATQMRMLAGTVVRRLNEELGDGTVARIEVRGPNLPTWKRGPRSVRDGRGPRDTYG